MRLEGLMNKEIAQELNVSEADISQTISRLTEKVKTVQDSIGLLTNMDIIQEGPKYILTEKGRRLARIPKRKSPKPIKHYIVFWHDFFEKRSAHASSEVFYSCVFVGGKKQTIAVFGVSDAQVSTLTEKREKRMLSTSESVQSLDTPKTGVLIL